MNKAIILDIDGVMIAYPEGDCNQPDFFSPEPIQALKAIFDAYPKIKVYLSTTMRKTNKGLEKFYRMWQSAGFHPEDIDGVIPFASVLTDRREFEIKSFINTFKDIAFIPIDDELIFRLPYMKTNARRGLTLEQARDIIILLNGGSVLTKSNISDHGWSYFVNDVDSL